jgi:FlaA1/EpsC-like NDP-sugar epimerase
MIKNSVEFNMKKYLITLPRFHKQLIVMLVDSLSIMLAVWFSYSIRLEQFHFPWGIEQFVYVVPTFIALPIFIKLGLYRAVFRYTGQHALWTIFRAVAIYGVLFFCLIIFWDFLYLPRDQALIPRSIGILQPIILLVLIVLSRSIARLWLSNTYLKHQKKKYRHTLIYGAGASGIQIANSLQQTGSYYLVGYIDEDPQLHHKTINGLTIYGVNEIDALIKEYGVTDILLALPSIHQSRRNEIVSELRQFHVHVRSLPSMSDLAEGKIKVSDIRELDVSDLLGRNPVVPYHELFKKNIADKVVMVTGAGGSIGSELARQIIFARPRALILLDQNEFSLYALDEELKRRIKDERLSIKLVPLLGSVREYDWIKKICNLWKINTIYHAAAYKHVPLVEHNVKEGILNNVWGTLNTARAAIDTGVNQFVLISTDKAVRPTNIMGASKRLAEMVLQALANKIEVQTQFSIVRFGNVLGSSGSVVPLFRDQINAGPVTVTHHDVTRYFMTIPEAAQLVIQAGAMASLSKKVAKATVFVLDMGAPIKVIDLAKKMIELSGCTLKDQFNPDGDIEIEIIGLRPGEKLYEELLIGSDPMRTNHPRIMKAQEGYLPWDSLEEGLEKLYRFISQDDVFSIYKLLQELELGFSPDADIVDLMTVGHYGEK